MPIQLIIIIAAVAAFAASNALSFSMGSKLGTAATEARWQRQIADSNKKLADAAEASKAALRAKDEELARQLATKTLRIADMEAELEAERTKTPLPAGCSACFIPRSRVERVRTGASPASGSEAARR